MGQILADNGLPLITSASAEAPFDFLADLLRSFTGISKDVRRHKSEVKEACEALLPLMIQKACVAPPAVDQMVFMPLHMPPYLSEKVFGELWWPTFKKMVEALVERGHYLYIFFEGDWTRYYDYLEELLKGLSLRGGEEAFVFSDNGLVIGTLSGQGDELALELQNCQENNIFRDSDRGKRLQAFLFPGRRRPVLPWFMRR